MSTGVAVMGHVGLTPQSISALGGFRPQGQTAREAVRVLREARVRARAPATRAHMRAHARTTPAIACSSARGTVVWVFRFRLYQAH